MKMNQKELWIGIGIGVAAGMTGGYFIGSRSQRKKDRKRAREQAHQAYLRGISEATEEAKGVIDDLMNNTVVVNATDDEDAIKQKIAEHFGTENSPKSEENPSEEDPDGQKLPPERPSKPKNDEEYGVKAEKIPESARQYPFTLSGDSVIFYGAAGTELRYPKFLVMNKRGELLEPLDIRENMRTYETDIRRLSVIWNTMGWGTYVPELDGPPGGEKNAWDENLDIDDEDGAIYGDEPEEKTREREKYLDELERYIAHPEEAPRIISKEEFYDECYLDKIYVDYYDVDKKFIENTDMNREIDPYTIFGVSDGDELFRKKIPEESDDDPDIVHVKNYKMNCVVEVTRFHRSYESIKDGSAFVHGSANPA